MRWKNGKVRKLFVGAASLAALFILGCASGVRTGYDGDYPPEPEQVTTLIPITIENHRTLDAIPPHFLLIGAGRHDLGPVEGMGGKLSRLIDTSWLGPSGCVRIVAHYVGTGDFVFDEFCWRAGERISVTLDDIFNPVAAWSHR